MTDREVLKAMFDRAGVVWSEDEDGMTVSENDGGEANAGYSYFMAGFGFNEDGSLKYVGAWE